MLLVFVTIFGMSLGLFDTADNSLMVVTMIYTMIIIMIFIMIFTMIFTMIFAMIFTMIFTIIIMMTNRCTSLGRSSQGRSRRAFTPLSALALSWVAS